MRTTIELNDEQRAKLLQLAAERGEKGFSRLVQEAVDAYLKEHVAKRELARAAQAVLGTAGEKFAAHLDEARRKSRESWR